MEIKMMYDENMNEISHSILEADLTHDKYKRKIILTDQEDNNEDDLTNN